MASRSLRSRPLDAQAARRVEQLFFKINDPTRNKRGDENEKFALKLVRRLAERCEIPATAEPYLTGHNSERDRRGEDIVIPTALGDVGIQIKSSQKKADEFRRVHPHIPCIVIPVSPAEALVSDLLKQAILGKYERLKRGRR